MIKRATWFIGMSVLLGSGTMLHAASGTCTDELKACRERCKSTHNFTGARLTSCVDQACPGAWGMCMHSGYWTIATTKQKLGPLQKK